MLTFSVVLITFSDCYKTNEIKKLFFYRVTEQVFDVK